MLHNRTQTGVGQLDSLLKGGINGFARMVAAPHLVMVYSEHERKHTN
jgi:hypothetical protein